MRIPLLIMALYLPAQRTMPGRAPVTVDRIQAIDIRSKRIIHQCTNRYPNRAIESREAQVNDEQQKDLSFLYPVGGYVCCILSEELRFLREFLLVSSSFSYSVIYLLSCFKLSIREPVHLPFTAVL